MDLTKQYDDVERRFLMNQPQELKNNNQPCELHTRTQGSLYRGRVLQADEGGIVFQHEDGRHIVVPHLARGEVCWHPHFLEPEDRRVGAHCGRR